MTNAIQKDLTSHFQQQIGEVLGRHVALGSTVLAPSEMGIMLVEGAVSFVLSAAATIATSAEGTVSAAAVYDGAIDMITAALAGERDRSLAAIAASRKERAA